MHLSYGGAGVKGQSSFHASRTGKCRGCNSLYHRGDNIWSPGKGDGAYHIKCQPELSTRQATAEELVAIKTRSDLRKRGIYSS